MSYNKIVKARDKEQYVRFKIYGCDVIMYRQKILSHFKLFIRT